MRKTLVPAALVLLITAFYSLPSSAVGGTCGACAGSYNSCMQNAYGDWDITGFEEDLCATMTAVCWSQCQSTQYQMCTYSYDFYACGQWYSDASWESRAYASHYCSDYSYGGGSSNCA